VKEVRVFRYCSSDWFWHWFFPLRRCRCSIFSEYGKVAFLYDQAPGLTLFYHIGQIIYGNDAYPFYKVPSSATPFGWKNIYDDFVEEYCDGGCE